MAKKPKGLNGKRSKKKDVAKASATIKEKLGGGGLGLAKKAPPTNTLPSKLLNMQFMKSAEEKRQQQVQQEEQAQFEDASRWSLKKKISIKPTVINTIRPTVRFADIIAEETGEDAVSGRRVFGDPSINKVQLTENTADEANEVEKLLSDIKEETNAKVKNENGKPGNKAENKSEKKKPIDKAKAKANKDNSQGNNGQVNNDKVGNDKPDKANMASPPPVKSINFKKQKKAVNQKSIDRKRKQKFQ